MNVLVAVFWVVCLAVLFTIVLPLMLLACAVYETLLALWWGWQWLKEMGK